MKKTFIKILAPLSAMILLSACGITGKKGSSSVDTYTKNYGQKTPAVQRAQERIERRGY